MNHPPNHIFAHTPETLADWCASAGMQRFRSKQILEWVYEKGVADPAAMTNLSALDKSRLTSGMTFLSGEVIRHQAATDGTQKLLVQWSDGTPQGPIDPAAGTLADHRSIPLPIMQEGHAPSAPGLTLDTSRQTECVMIPSLPRDEDGGEERIGAPAPRSRPERAAPGRRSPRDRDDPDAHTGGRRDPSRHTACISSQVGCPVGCKFCASGLGGLEGNLSAGRIVEQVWRLGRLPDVRRITNVVFMGMGEPLSNLGAVVPAVRIMSSLWGLGISARKITISTVGLPKAIDKLAESLDLPVTLALSLHAPNDALRRQLIPWAEYTTIDDLLAACSRWFQKTGREITLEYTLLRGVNDRPEHAQQLAAVASTLRANINLIRYNEVAGMPFKRPLTDDVLAFQSTLRDRGVNTHIRASRGRDIAAACGQLRHEARPAPGGLAPAP